MSWISVQFSSVLYRGRRGGDDVFKCTVNLAFSVTTLLLLLCQVSASDEDRGSFGVITYSLGAPASRASSQDAFTVDKGTGQLCTNAALDRDEGQERFELTVTATDGVRRLLTRIPELAMKCRH